MSKVKRTRICTVCEVVNAEGQTIGEIIRAGTVSLARMANCARRDYNNPTYTVRNLRRVKETFTMQESEFYKLAQLEKTE